MMQLDNALLDGPLGDKPVNGDRTLLPQAMRTVGGLIFYSRIPPRIHVNDIIRGGQAQSNASSSKANQEYIAFASLKSGDALVARTCRGAAIEVLVRDALAVQFTS